MISRKELDLILEEHIGKKGTFVEIGAYDGETLSNTCHLADNGWKGYYYEPITEYADKCQKRHEDNTVIVFNVGIGKQGNKILFKSGMLSTLKNENYQKQVEKLPWFKDTTFEQCIVTIQPAGLLPKCDFLVIDVEGTEHDIIEELVIRPKVLMVELHEQSPEWQQIADTSKTLELILNMGYNKIYSDDVDSIFIYGK